MNFRYWTDQAEIQHDQSIVSLATITDANGLYKDPSNRSISIDEYKFDIKYAINSTERLSIHAITDLTKYKIPSHLINVISFS